MADEWREYKIGEIADVIGGSTPSTKDPSNFNGNIPWLTPKDLSGPHERYVTGGERSITEKGLASCSAQLLPANAVLLSSRAPIGYLAIAKNHIATNQGFRNLVLKPGFDPLFVYYWLKGNHDELDRHASGSTFRELSGSSLKQIRILAPDHNTQRAIAHILGTLDDKIELNRRKNETLEAIARAIFKSWFVDFDPVRAMAEGRDPGLPKHIADLFPDTFSEAEIGHVPQGWKIDHFSDHFTVTKGLSYKGRHLAAKGEGLPMHNLNSVYEGGGYKHEGLKWYTGEYKDRHLVRPGDMIVTNTEQGFKFLLIGYAAIVPKTHGDIGLFSHHLYQMRPRQGSPIKPSFVYLLLRTKKFHDTVAGYTNGTTVNMLPADGLERPRFAVPPKPLLDRLYALMNPVLERAETIYEENAALATLRDALVPKLISGELRLKDENRIIRRRA